jgi:ankyrin repeat protein
VILAGLLLLSVKGLAADRSLIADAAMKADKAAVRTLLRQHADVNASQTDGATALHWAVYQDDLETVELLLHAGANPKAINREGASVLSLACINGNAAVIEKLLQVGANANERLPNGETPLMIASRTGKMDAIRVLLAHGADVNAKENLRGTTALMWAAANGNAAAAKVLIENGANVSVRSGAAPKGRAAYLAPTVKERARQGGAAGAAEGAAGEGQRAQRGQRQQRAAEAQQGKADVDQDLADRLAFLSRADQDGGGLTSLVMAARRGDIETIRVLLAAGADVNQVTNYGWSALLTATQNRFYKLALFLLDNGANPNVANKGGWTPLYLATDNRNIENGDYPTRKPDVDDLEYIKVLLARGANPNARMKDSTETRTIFTHQWLYEDGATAFLRASQSSDIRLMRLLLEHGADPTIATTNGTTPLMVASGIGWVEGVTNERGAKENLEAVKLLLELGANVNAIDGDGRTALHGAAHKGRNEIVQLLVDNGARLDARDGGSRDSIAGELLGHTWIPLDYADGLVRVGVQSAIPHPATSALLRKLMTDRGLPVPPPNRTLDSICITELCR